jgi:phosphate:Na+ symporter
VELLQIVMTGMTAVILFIFGLDNFSKEIQGLAGEHFRKSLSTATKWPIVGVIIGALVTMVIQSSSATSVIAISLVNAGVLSFKNSVGIIFGSNIGTTITAQLVAFKLTNFAPYLIIFGFILSLLHNRVSIFGKAIFYFGFVFFSLNLISSTLLPLQQNEALLSILTQPQHPFYAIAFGCIFTALVQSSSVTTGLAIIFAQQGLIGLENAVPLVLGANIGTTATAFIAVFNMDISAKKAALSHFFFNVGGVVIFLPVLLLFGDQLSKYNDSPAIALANIHLIFNVVASLIFTAFINPFTRLIDYLLGEGKMDFERLNLPKLEEGDDFFAVKKKLEAGSDSLFSFLQENYNAVTLSVETNYQGIYDAADKRIQYLDFVKKEYLHFFAKAVSLIKEEKESKALIKIINQFDYLFQIHDSITDLFESKRVMKEQFIELKSDLLLVTRALSMQTLEYFNEIALAMHNNNNKTINSQAKELQQEIDSANRALLLLMIDPKRTDAGALTNFVTYSQRLKDKLTNLSHLHIKIEDVEEVSNTLQTD